MWQFWWEAPEYLLKNFIQNFEMRPKEDNLSFHCHTGEMPIQKSPTASVTQLCTPAPQNTTANSQVVGYF